MNIRIGRKGFTLLELLVVIGIISILVAVGSTSYSAAQKKARDARRKADLRSVKNAMEQYYTLCNGSYPATGAGNILPGSITTATPACSIATTIMAQTPRDPKTGGAYVYFTSPPPAGYNPYSLCTWNHATNPSVMESETAIYCISLEQ